MPAQHVYCHRFSGKPEEKLRLAGQFFERQDNRAKNLERARSEKNKKAVQRLIKVL